MLKINNSKNNEASHSIIYCPDSCDFDTLIFSPFPNNARAIYFKDQCLPTRLSRNNTFRIYPPNYEISVALKDITLSSSINEFTVFNFLNSLQLPCKTI